MRISKEVIRDINRCMDKEKIEKSTLTIKGESFPCYKLNCFDKYLLIWNTSNNEHIHSWCKLKSSIIDYLLDGYLENHYLRDGSSNFWAFRVVNDNCS